MRIFILKTLFFFHVLVIFNVVAYAFDINKHSSSIDQSIKAMVFDNTGTSYIYEKSLDMSDQKKRNYKVVINNQEYPLPIEKNKDVISQFGFVNFSEYYKTIFMIVAKENKLVLAYLPKKTDKTFLIKEFKIGSYEGSLESYKALTSNGKLIIVSGNNQIYILDLKANNLKKYIKIVMNRTVTDYAENNNQSYFLFVGTQRSNENTLYLSVFNKDMSIKKEVEYSAKNKIIDSRFLSNVSNNISIVVQSFNKDLLPTSYISNIHKVHLNLLKSKVISSEKLFPINMLSNLGFMDNLVFISSENSIYWCEKSDKVRAKLLIKSTGKNKNLVELPEMSYVGKVFIGSTDKKIKIMVNFGKQMGKNFTQGFGSDEIEL